MVMRPITLGFTPISDVTAFTHRDGYTFLRILEMLRKKINELVAAYTTLIAAIETQQDALQVAFDEWSEIAAAPMESYVAMVDKLESLYQQLIDFAPQDTDYAAEFTATLNN